MKTLLQTGATLCGCVLLQWMAFASKAAADDYQVCGLYLGEDPSGSTGWSEEVSGLAHDDTHWYITQADPDAQGGSHAHIWRIPAWVDLGLPFLDLITTPGVTRIDVNEAMSQPENAAVELRNPVVYQFGGVDYLLFTESGPDCFGGRTVYLTVFEAATLTALDWVLLGQDCELGLALAVDPQGILYFQTYWIDHSPLIRFQLNWSVLQDTGQITGSFGSTFQLLDEAGLPLGVGPESMEFTADGRYLYVLGLSNIQVFDTSTRRRVLQSTNGSGPFNFQVDWLGDETPVGLTLWDMDGISSPYGDGQLHIIVRRDDDLSADDAFLKHYTNVIRVQAGAPLPGYGTPDDPFPTVTAAANWIWPPGCEIRISTGNYDEALTISQRVRVTSVGGTVRIGG